MLPSIISSQPSEIRTFEATIRGGSVAYMFVLTRKRHTWNEKPSQPINAQHLHISVLYSQYSNLGKICGGSSSGAPLQS